VNREDNPVEALIRHRIEVHDSAHVRFLHDLMAVMITAIGVGMTGAGVWFLFSGMLMVTGVVMVVNGVFLTFWGPYSRRKIREDTARKTAAALYQLEQVKAYQSIHPPSDGFRR
jgi:protein-S-isoprenylcysteine O-methyltransferase Ste14